jgi:uncharacterized protein (TIGR03437 family)
MCPDSLVHIVLMTRVASFAAVLLGLSGLLSAQFTPSPGSPFSVPQHVVSLAVGDFNNDAKADIAVVGVAGYGGAVSTLLSDGSGGFTVSPHSPYPANGGKPGLTAVSLAPGDFFNDGNLSLAVGNTADNVPIMRGGGNGVFQTVVRVIEAGEGPIAIAVGDFNTDGNLDLAFGYGNDTLVVFFGNGSGLFPPATNRSFPVGGVTSFIRASDLNGDGKLDLALVSNGSVTVFLGDGAGGFSAAPGSPFIAGKNPSSIAVGDFNGDGKPDMVVANAGSANVTLLLGNGQGGFSPAPASPFQVAAGPGSVIAADFNSDGALDIAVANSIDGTVTVLMGNGAGGFAPSLGSPFSAGKNPLYIAAADFNGDGKPDLAIANQGSDNVTVLLNDFPPRSGPLITNVQNAATLLTTIGSDSYIAIFGKNLSTTNPGRNWTSSDFTSNTNATLRLPTSLDGTSVLVGGVPAYVSYVSSGQINIVSPRITGPDTSVVVTMNGQESLPFTVNVESLRPSFFTWQPATSDFGKYPVAQHAAYTNVGKVALFPGAPPDFTTPAKPGETILLYGTGFGPTNPPIAEGIETDKIYALLPTPTATLGNLPATVTFAGLIPPLSQVYQINVTIPLTTPDGDQPLTVTVNGTHSYAGLITVQK